MNLDLNGLKRDYENPLVTDTELVFLHGLITSINPKCIVEIGGGREGFSTTIFLKSIENRENSVLYTIDFLEMAKRGHNHILIQKNCNDVTPQDLNFQKIDIVFFDAHCFHEQLNFYYNMKENDLISDETILILHDTNLFYDPYVRDLFYKRYLIEGKKTEEGYINQLVERSLVNYFKKIGYDVFNLGTRKENHNWNYRFLFGICVCQKFKPFVPDYFHYQK